jgi:hypothetical protein
MSSPAADATDAADAAADLLSLFEGAQPTPQAGAPSAMVAIATTTPAALSNDLTNSGFIKSRHVFIKDQHVGGVSAQLRRTS